MPEKSKDEAVNPKHYSSFGDFAAIRIIRQWTRIRKDAGVKPVSFNVGNALKYMQRAGFKPGEDEVRDLEKAIWYLQSEVHELDPTRPDPSA